LVLYIYMFICCLCEKCTHPQKWSPGGANVCKQFLRTLVLVTMSDLKIKLHILYYVVVIVGKL